MTFNPHESTTQINSFNNIIITLNSSFRMLSRSTLLFSKRKILHAYVVLLAFIFYRISMINNQAICYM